MSIEGKKVMNETITGRWGLYLVSSMAKKIIDKVAHERAEKLRAENDKDSAHRVYNELQKKYKNHSNSFITLEKGAWVRYGNSHRGYKKADYYEIKFEFPNGSEISFELNIWNDKVDYKVKKAHDAEYKAVRGTEEWLEKFNNQK